MKQRVIRLIGLAALVAVMTAVQTRADDDDDRYYTNYDDDRYREVKIDPYLSVEVWTSHDDGEYFDGDRISISFMANRDCFVTIYSIDTRGRVSMLFPAEEGASNYINGGVTYRLPGDDDDYDLVVSGPAGVENLQIIASREPFPIPDWYPNSGLVCDWDDRLEYMDYLNSHYFVRYDGQRFAFNRAAVYVNEWEPDYYRPVYAPYYPHWTVCGNVYIDYPYGGTVYINGIYWGCAPLYIPRIFVGWHTITVYDPYGWCWESDIHITRYNTVVLDRHVIVPRQQVMSKYKEVQRVGYRDPAASGYPDYKTKVVASAKVHNKSAVTGGVNKLTPNGEKGSVVTSKKYVRGGGELVKTERGYETAGSSMLSGKKSTTSRSKTYDGGSNSDGQSAVKGKSSRSSGGTVESGTSSGSKSGSDVYTKKSGSTSKPSASGNKSSGSTKKSGTYDKSGSKPAAPSSSGGSKKSTVGGAKKSSSSGGSKSSSDGGSSKPSVSGKSSSSSGVSSGDKSPSRSGSKQSSGGKR